MKDWKTTLVAALVFIGVVCKVVVDVISGNPFDFSAIWQALVSLLIAIGLWKAADSRP